MKLARPWLDLIINPPCRTAPNKLSPICHEKLLEKDPSILYGGNYALAQLENHVGVYIASKFAEIQTRIWQKNIVWQSSSVGWGII